MQLAQLLLLGVAQLQPFLNGGGQNLAGLGKTSETAAAAPATAAFLEFLLLLVSENLGERAVHLFLQVVQLLLLGVGQFQARAEEGEQDLAGLGRSEPAWATRAAATAAEAAATTPEAAATHAGGFALLVADGGGDEHLVSQDDGRRPAVAGQFDLPGDVLVGAPPGRLSLVRGRAGAFRAKELRPVGSPRRGLETDQHDNSDNEFLPIHDSFLPCWTANPALERW